MSYRIGRLLGRHPVSAKLLMLLMAISLGFTAARNWQALKPFAPFVAGLTFFLVFAAAAVGAGVGMRRFLALLIKGVAALFAMLAVAGPFIAAGTTFFVFNGLVAAGLWYGARRIERPRPSRPSSRALTAKAQHPDQDVDDDVDALGDVLDVVGESHYQQALTKIVGGKSETGAYFECQAVLVPEPENIHDHNAIRVEIDGRKVGYISREEAPAVGALIKRTGGGNQSLTVGAVIVGGWKSAESTGHFGVQIHLDRG